MLYDVEEYVGFPEELNPDDWNSDNILNLARVRANYVAEEQAITAEIKRLTEKRDSKRLSAERVKEGIHRAMLVTGIDKAKDDIFTVSLRNKPDRVVVSDESRLPIAYWTITKKPNLTAIGKAFKTNGEIPSGCELAPEEKTVSIR